ncbi:MAG: sulfide/dihydroorotate dehydrogenase-like FAD/NAD-binding protein [Fimbriimonadaceae bacterium]|nr:sulfide/dihydroorotate dehydrogenase-like FAD/NAD-binding protein [Fimbriimonadaceae bacterium]
MYRIVERRQLVPDTHLLVVEAPHVARKVQAGQFIILRPHDEGERIPLSVADWDRDAGTVTSVFLEAGASTMQLAKLQPGDTLPTYMGPLGTVAEVERVGTVVCCGGCYGIGALLPIVRAHKEAGNEVICILEAHSSWLLYWVDRHREVADQVHVVTSDGSAGDKGLSFDILQQRFDAGQPIDAIHAIGCTFMMERNSLAALAKQTPIRITLNPVMVDGTGMCGGCRCVVNGERKFACVDGPEFDGREVDWTALVERRKSYRAQEIASLQQYESRGFLGSSAAVETLGERDE